MITEILEQEVNHLSEQYSSKLLKASVTLHMFNMFFIISITDCALCTKGCDVFTKVPNTLNFFMAMFALHIQLPYILKH